jgi:hypothetical protein
VPTPRRFDLICHRQQHPTRPRPVVGRCLRWAARVAAETLSNGQPYRAAHGRYTLVRHCPFATLQSIPVPRRPHKCPKTYCRVEISGLQLDPIMALSISSCTLASMRRLSQGSQHGHLQRGVPEPAIRLLPLKTYNHRARCLDPSCCFGQLVNLFSLPSQPTTTGETVVSAAE